MTAARVSQGSVSSGKGANAKYVRRPLETRICSLVLCLPLILEHESVLWCLFIQVALRKIITTYLLTTQGLQFCLRYLTGWVGRGLSQVFRSAIKKQLDISSRLSLKILIVSNHPNTQIICENSFRVRRLEERERDGVGGGGWGEEVDVLYLCSLVQNKFFELPDSLGGKASQFPLEFADQ